MDGVKLQFDRGDTIVLAFADSTDPLLERQLQGGLPIHLLLVVDEKQPCEVPCPGGGSIEISVGSGVIPDRWRAVAVCHPRFAWEDYALDLTRAVEGLTGSIRVRLVWTALHSMDMAALLLPSGEATGIHPLRITEALHSREGMVSDALRRPDSSHVEVQPEDTLRIRFETGPEVPPNQVPDFVLSTRGYYVDAIYGREGSKPLAATGPDPVPAPPWVAPNPSHQGEPVSIVVGGMEETTHRVTVCDVHGRVIRVLDAGTSSPTAEAIEWDGRTGDGAVAAPGVYFVVRESSRGRVSERLVVLP